MQFQFDSLQALWQMEGHGPYVWVCYAVTFFVFAFLIGVTYRRKNQFIRQQKRILARQEDSPADSSRGKNYASP